MTPAVCLPVKELKNTADFTEKVQEATGPVIVTKNGQGAFVSMSMECYDALCLEAARAKLYEAIDAAEEDVAAGRLEDACETSASLRQKYGL